MKLTQFEMAEQFADKHHAILRCRISVNAGVRPNIRSFEWWWLEGGKWKKDYEGLKAIREMQRLAGADAPLGRIRSALIFVGCDERIAKPKEWKPDAELAC